MIDGVILNGVSKKIIAFKHHECSFLNSRRRDDSLLKQRDDLTNIDRNSNVSDYFRLDYGQRNGNQFNAKVQCFGARHTRVFGSDRSRLNPQQKSELTIEEQMIASIKRTIDQLPNNSVVLIEGFSALVNSNVKNDEWGRFDSDLKDFTVIQPQFDRPNEMTVAFEYATQKGLLAYGPEPNANVQIGKLINNRIPVDLGFFFVLRNLPNVIQDIRNKQPSVKQFETINDVFKKMENGRIEDFQVFFYKRMQAFKFTNISFFFDSEKKLLKRQFKKSARFKD